MTDHETVSDYRQAHMGLCARTRNEKENVLV